jgi:small conductance mechanosensitive channel
LEKFSDVAQDPKPQVGIQGFEDYYIEIGYRYWIPTVRYFQISCAVNLAVYKALEEAKITIPYPQQEVRVLSGASLNKN